MSITSKLRRSSALTMQFLLLLMVSTAMITGSSAGDLINAARAQDIKTMQTLLSDGADPNDRQADGATALHWAVYRENIDMVAMLIAAGADVDAVNRFGASPLYVAAKSGQGNLIEQLLDAGANPNLALLMNETPIMTASRSGTLQGVQRLIAAGADVNARENSRQQTALMWASAQGHVDVAQALTEAGADLEARSAIRPMLMYTDALNGGAFDQGVMEPLGGFSALLFAARQGDVKMTRLLLDAGADVDGIAGNGTSALVLATHSGHGAVAALLLDAGADANAMEAGYSALHAAILRGDLNTVVALLEHGADPNARLLRANPVQRASEDWALKTPLVGATAYWIAASFRETEIMRALADAGADPLLTNAELLSRPRNREDRESYTPEVVDGLATAVQAAIKGDSTRGRFYVQANPDPIGEEQLALAAVILAAEHGVNLNHADFTGSTALHDAASRSLPNIIRVLAERGADVNALNGRGLTPLDLAIAAAARPNFFGFDTAISGPSASEVLEEFGAIRAQQL